MPRSALSTRLATLACLAAGLVACAQPTTMPHGVGAKSDLPDLSRIISASAVLPSPSPTVTPTGAPSASPTPLPREILPFRAGAQFEFQVDKPLGIFGSLPLGTLDLDIQRVEGSDPEVTDLTLTYRAVGVAMGQPKPYQIVLREGLFNFDGKPFVPVHMRDGDSWYAQDGWASVQRIEWVDVPAAVFPACYRVHFLKSASGESMVLWFAPGVGLVKGEFNGDFGLSSAFGSGRISLARAPLLQH